jgi:hypothetical protein
MLGELIGEGSGRIESIRVLPDRSLSSSGPPELEVSFQGTGELLGLAVTVVGTYSQIILPGGSLYGEGRTLFVTEDGETLSWKGFGVGRSIGRGSAASFGVAGAFLATSPRLARLSNVATVAEYVIDEERNLQWQGWEWTGPVRPVPLEPESGAEAVPSTTGAV